MHIFNIINLSTIDYIYIVGVIVILFFAIAFISLAIFFFNAKKKIIIHNIDNNEIEKEIEKELVKHFKNKKTKENIIEYYEKRKKKNKILGKIGTSVVVFLYGFVLILIGFSISAKKNNQQIWFGNQAMLIIQTDSMSQVYKGNTYLSDDNKLGNENRIQQYSFITISREQKYIDNIKPFDIVAFKMKSSDEKSDITVVHRLIEITYDGNGASLYTFRGDANPKSMAGEFQISKDRIVGVFETDGFKGQKNLAFGYLISYLQSNIGIIISVIALLLVLIYSILVDKLFSIYDQKYKELLLLRFQKINEDTHNDDVFKNNNVLKNESIFEISPHESKEVIKEKIEQIVKTNNIKKENVIVKKGRVFYRDSFGKFITLSAYLESIKTDNFKENKNGIVETPFLEKKNNTPLINCSFSRESEKNDINNNSYKNSDDEKKVNIN